MILFSRRVVLPNEVCSACIQIEQGIIQKVWKSSVPPKDAEDYGNKIIFPGFIDQHIHGWARGSFWYQGTVDSIKYMSIDLARTGVTSFLPTTGAESLEDTLPGLYSIKEYKNIQENQQKPIGAEVLGVHLEGPFLNKKFKGMQKEESCINPNKEFFDSMWEACGQSARLMTLAPELEGAEEMIPYIRSKGVQISIGHSDASFADITDRKDLGLGGFTHTYSGMRGFHHREIGCVGAAMYFEDLYCEFAKQTALTVSFEALEIMYRLKGANRIILTTDNVGMTHVKSARSHYIRQCTFIPRENNQLLIKYDDGREEMISKDDYNAVCNIELSYLLSVKNLVRILKPSLCDLAKITSSNSAQYINVFDRKGSLEIGKDADIILLDDDFNLHKVWCKGEVIC